MLENYWPEFLMLFTFNLLNLISPGAGCTLTIRNSAIYSRKIGLYTGFGIVSSSIIHKTYSLLGFGLVISETPWLFNIIKYVGSGYLFYLGAKCLISGFNYNKNNNKSFNKEKIESLIPSQAFKMGFLTDLLNPTASLGFITILSATVSQNTPNHLLILYGFVMICCSIIWYSTLAIFFSNNFIKVWLNRLGFMVEGIAGCFLIFLSIKLSGLFI